MSEGVWIGGVHAVEAALRAGNVRRLRIAAGRGGERLGPLLERAKRDQVRVERADRRALDALVPESHQGVVAELLEAAVELGDEAALEARLAAAAEPFLLVLEGILDPRNLGACLRSAEAAGVDAVILPRSRMAPLNAAARKTAAGAAERLPLFAVANLARTLRTLQEDFAVRCFGLAGAGEARLWSADLTGPCALVLGAEDRGLRALTMRHCDGLLALPMAGEAESLNVSVAAGVALFEAVRQRRSP